MIYWARTTLIRIGKALPFLICGLLLIYYIECLACVHLECYSLFGDTYIPSTKISWYIAKVFEYNVQTLFVMAIISISVETCFYNKLCVLYLSVNLILKHYLDFEVEIWLFNCICILNIIVCSFLCFKGIKRIRI